jgi:hypothetical protein
MIKTVKCVTKGCELKDYVVTTTALFLSKIAPLDGPFPCPKCGKPMKVVARIPANKGKSGKTVSRPSSKPPAKKLVGRKKRPKGIKIKIGGRKLGTRYKNPTKKPGARKRGPGKS